MFESASLFSRAVPISAGAGVQALPLAASPNGEYNFVNPPSQGWIMTAACTPFFVLSCLFFIIRIYARGFLVRKTGWDDLTCTIGFLCVVAYYVLGELSVTHAPVGTHTWNVQVGQLGESDFYIISYLQGIINPIGLGFIKLTFFLLFMQIFSPFNYMRIAIWAGAVTSTLFYTLIVILALDFTTKRKGETWAEHLVTNLETDEINLSIPQAGISVFFDFYILILPIFGVFKLQLSSQRRIAVSLVFATGFLACITSIITLVYRVKLKNTADLLHILLPTVITSQIEMEIGLICSCAPVLSLIGKRVATQGFTGLLSTRKTHTPTGASTKKSNRSGESNEYIPFDADSKNDQSFKNYDLELGNIDAGTAKYGVHKNPVKTFIKGGAKGQDAADNDDGIHLKHDILQENANKD